MVLMAWVAISLPLADAVRQLEDNFWTEFLLICGIISALILCILFSIGLSCVFMIRQTILKLEKEQNSKFKTMLNSIKDAVIVVKGDCIKFLNFYAKELIAGSSD